MSSPDLRMTGYFDAHPQQCPTAASPWVCRVPRALPQASAGSTLLLADMYLKKGSRVETAAIMPSEKQLSTRIGTTPEWNPCDLSSWSNSLLLCTSHSKSLQRPEIRSDKLNSLRPDLQEGGFRDGWVQEVFSREIQQHRHFVVRALPVVGLRRRHECRSVGIDLERGEGSSLRQLGSHRRHHAVRGHRHRKHGPDSRVGRRWGGRR